MNDTGNTILLRLSIHCAICCGVIVVKLCNLARVGLRAKGFGGGMLSMVVTLPAEQSGSLSSSILTDGMLIVLGKLWERQICLLFSHIAMIEIIEREKIDLYINLTLAFYPHYTR